MKTRTPVIALFALLTLSLAACTSGGAQPPASGGNPIPITTPTTPANPTSPSGGGQGATVYVDSIEILTLESFPVQMSANVKGNLPDPCTTITSAASQRDGNTFNIDIATTRDEGRACIQVLSPFEQSVALDVVGLKAGTYTVVAGDVSETFELKVDNVLP